MHDAIVIGAGVAGLTAAVRLAEGGKRVLVLAAGVGAIQLAGGTIDVLGYTPARVDDLATALPEFVAAHPDHPYAHIGPDQVRSGLAWWQQTVEVIHYIGSADENLLLPTAVGVPKPTALAPETMVAGDVRRGGRFAIVGCPSLKDFYPSYVAANLAATSGLGDGDLSARSLEIAVATGEADLTSLGIARRFDDPQWRKAVIADLRGRVEPGEAVGFPAALGVDDARSVWEELQDGLGSRVFEIPTLPPSVPGIRLLRVLKAAFRRAGGRLIIGGPVIGAVTTGDMVEGVVVAAAARSMTYRADDYVLASGGFAAGGIEMSSDWNVREPIFGLPIAGAPPKGSQRLKPDYFDHHPIARAGIATDGLLRPVGDDGRPMFRNLYAAGATLAGAEPWREKSGEGISISTGHYAAGQILEGRA